MERVSISKEEYEKLKMRAKINLELLIQFKNSLEDVKTGRIRKVA